MPEHEQHLAPGEPNEQAFSPEDIQQIKDNILEQWRQLPLQERGDVIAQLIGEIREKMLPVNKAAELTGYSQVRLRELIRDGKLEGVDFSRGRILGGVYTTIEAVEGYRRKPPPGLKPWVLEKLARETESK